jgi:ribosomal protein S8
MSSLACNALAIINAGYKNRKLLVRVKRSKLVLQILNLFYSNGFIRGFSLSNSTPYEIIVFLKYIESKPVLRGFEILSSAGRRTYCKSSYVFNRLCTNGFFIISTSSLGLVTSLQLLAFRSTIKTGGELLFKVLI